MPDFSEARKDITKEQLETTLYVLKKLHDNCGTDEMYALDREVYRNAFLYCRHMRFKLFY